MNEPVRAELKPMAEEVLSVFSIVEAAAREQLQAGGGITMQGLTPINTYNTPALLGTLRQIESDRLRAAHVLLSEPALARVQARDQSGAVRTYYLCRVSPPSIAGTVLMSYRAPAGAIVTREVGEEFVLPNGDVLEVLSKLLLRPRQQKEWDSVDTRYVDAPDHALTIESLRALLDASEPDAVDLLAKILASESEAQAVREGLRRAVITKMGLRDQPVLDRFQDQIFRMPLASRLLLLGAPGTGKTTTLIRRIGQKLESLHLDEAERAQVARMERDRLGSLTQAWLMFTPTRLLQHYVKDAFAREGVPATEQQIRTWDDHRLRLGRDVFRILRGPTGTGHFVFKASAETLRDEALNDMAGWYQAFHRWQSERYIEQVRVAAQALMSSTDPAVTSLGEAPLEALQDAAPEKMAPFVVALMRQSEKVRSMLAELRQAADSPLKESLNLQLNRNRRFLNELAAFLDTLQPETEADAEVEDPDDPEEADDSESEADGDRAPQQTGLGAAVQVYMRALRAHARAVTQRRSLRANGRNALLVNWLGARMPTSEQIAVVGKILTTQSSVRRISQPIRRYLAEMPRRYREFRRQMAQQERWYLSGAAGTRDIHPHEVDLVALATLRSAHGILEQPSVSAVIEEPQWTALRDIRDQFKMQIMVDEATDFSALQLGCMFALAHPASRSFFSCGDFNQRLTDWGVKSEHEFMWACPGIEPRRVTISYRQSSELNDFARGLVGTFGGDTGTVQMPPGVDASAVAPLLAEQLGEDAEIAHWVAARVQEIARMVAKLPSIAVLVPEEDLVEPMARLLRAELAEVNIPVEGCPDGTPVGTEEKVRVFNVKHIKGLEFEAVVFVSVDELATVEPLLFDKYLYVGATRAATYLALTCKGQLPLKLAPVREQFRSSWAP